MFGFFVLFQILSFYGHYQVLMPASSIKEVIFFLFFFFFFYPVVSNEKQIRKAGVDAM